MKSDHGKAARAVVSISFCAMGCGKILRDESNVCKECYEEGKRILKQRAKALPDEERIERDDGEQRQLEEVSDRLAQST